MHSSDPINRLMTQAVLTVDINDPAGEVLRLLAGYPVHHLPVLDQQKVVGMLSSADLMKLELFLPKGAKSPIEYLNRQMTVGRLVRGPVLTVQPHQSVESAAQLMAQHGVHALAVVNAQDHLLGIVTTTDIIHAALSGNNDRPPQAASAASGAEPQRMRLSAEQLGQAMAAAAAQAGTDRDPDFVHQAVADMHVRVALLEKVRHAASRFMQAGQDQTLHSTLRKALDALNRAEEQGYAESVNGS